MCLDVAAGRTVRKSPRNAYKSVTKIVTAPQADEATFNASKNAARQTKANYGTSESQLTRRASKLTEFTVTAHQFSCRKLEANTTQIICGVCGRGGAPGRERPTERVNVSGRRCGQDGPNITAICV
jgi:hypothetical protein